MALPNPLPDDPKKWDGWRNYNSDNLYERLCLDYEDAPDNTIIEDHCRQLLIWWQKKLPLKNQPSNPITAMLRTGMDEAPRYLSQARAELLDPESRRRFDAVLQSKLKERAQAEFHKFLSFSIARGVLSRDAEARLVELGVEQGLDTEEISNLIDHELAMAGAVRERDSTELRTDAAEGPRATSTNPENEFLRVLNMAGFEGGDMTDDQRDAFVNIAESLGIDPGRAEDMIDEWIEQQEAALFGAISMQATAKATPAPIAKLQPKPVHSAPPVKATSKVIPLHVERDMDEEQERRLFSPFRTASGIEMLFVPSGSFLMGSEGPEATLAEGPEHRVHLTRFYIARTPVTHAQFEEFDPSHRSKRPPWAEDHHPVVYVTSIEAARFCEWLSAREGKKFRLPTESEWEYAARGKDGRLFPWGNVFDSGDLANFADRNTRFAWSDARVDDGFAATSPVGSYPRGASPFGLLDMAGNVWEWCRDYYAPYSKQEQRDPQGPPNGSKRVYRGGSWRSRIASLRCAARSFNAPTYSYNDVGFRIACTCPG